MYKMKRGTAFENIMRHRVEDGLKIREARFRLEHTGDSDLQLITYVRQCAKEMGHTPNGCEVVGGSYIAERFGGWGKVVKLCASLMFLSLRKELMALIRPIVPMLIRSSSPTPVFSKRRAM